MILGIHPIDLTIFILYLIFMLGVGVFFMRRNKSEDDYYVGGRGMSAGHIGLSFVATDVGGGFSIGLGGLGFAIGISGSWMLFTGLLGAWLSAVILIPKVYPIAKKHNFLTFPQVLSFHYTPKVAVIAGIISLIGYIGFTSSQILAGAKLASATFPEISIDSAVYVMGAIAIIYTVIGGIKAVIYTDTIQWTILMVGLIFIGIPIAYTEIGGWEAIVSVLPPSHISLTNITAVQSINWLVTIVPIWFVGMTLYQRIYACRDEKTAKKAWRIAGLFEWPVMAFMGTALGLFSRVAFEQRLIGSSISGDASILDPELGLPMLLSEILPIGLMGLMMSAYFSAIMSTADSCLMAASGNLTTDLWPSKSSANGRNYLLRSQIITLIIGIIAILLAGALESVLELMLYSYGFMVSGLFVPVIAALFVRRPSPAAALAAMIAGGGTTLALSILTESSGPFLPFGLDPNIFGISVSALIFTIIHSISINSSPRSSK